MSNKIAKANRNRKRTVGCGMEITGQLMEYLTAVIMAVLCVVVPFYAKNGYHQIGNAKFAVYRAILTTGGVILLVGIVPYLFFRMRTSDRLRVSVTDKFVFAYLVLTGISVISGGYYKDALWGCFGWNMGLMSQLSFVLLYLFLSRFGRYHRMILTLLCTAAGVVYAIGILHRLLIDPIGFYDGLSYAQKAQFLSTLGQASWYGSFLAVTLPIGIGVFLHTEKTAWRILSGLFTILGFCTLVTQNSDSAYFALAGALVVLFMTTASEQKKMCRFMGMLTLFFASGKIMAFLMRLRPNPELKVDYVTRLMWSGSVTWLLLGICLSAAILLYVMGVKERQYPTATMNRAGQILPVAAVAAALGIVLVICLQTRGSLPQAVSDKLAGISYFNWNDEWGNGRGRIWQFSWKLFSEEKVMHKLFGVGPDCFHSYVNAYYNGEEELLWGQKQLTNAHNEWLNILINGGIFGAVAYLGIYVTAVRRFFRSHQQDGLLAGITAACISYMCYNFFCYQQVLCTPFVFICMGIGEYIMRHFNEDGKRRS